MRYVKNPGGLQSSSIRDPLPAKYLPDFASRGRQCQLADFYKNVAPNSALLHEITALRPDI